MIFAIAFGAVFFGAILIMLIARYSPDAANARLQEQRRKDEAAGKSIHPPIPYDEWRMLIIDLLEALGFHIALEHQSATELDIICKSTEPLRGGRYIVHATGGFFLTRTRLRGRVHLRTTLMNPFTQEADLVGLLDAIRATQTA